MPKPLSGKTAQDRYKRYLRRIEQSNAAFRRMLPSQRRVVIAKDVKEMVKMQILRPTKAGYGLYSVPLAQPGQKSERIVDWFPQKGIVCEACAKGAVAFGALLRHADTNRDSVFFGAERPSEWEDAADDWEDMERAFEAWRPERIEDGDDDPVLLARFMVWYKMPLKLFQRMEMVMDHVIRREGAFNYEDFLKFVTRGKMRG